MTELNFFKGSAMSLPTSPGSAARRRDARSEEGSILILTALSMVVLLGMVALAVDGSYMFTERNRMSAAADSGAISAALDTAATPARAMPT